MLEVGVKLLIMKHRRIEGESPTWNEGRCQDQDGQHRELDAASIDQGWSDGPTVVGSAGAIVNFV